MSQLLCHSTFYSGYTQNITYIYIYLRVFLKSILSLEVKQKDPCYKNTKQAGMLTKNCRGPN